MLFFFAPFSRRSCWFSFLCELVRLYLGFWRSSQMTERGTALAGQEGTCPGTGMSSHLLISASLSSEGT